MINLTPYFIIKCTFVSMVIEAYLAYLLKVNKTEDILKIALVNLITSPIIYSIPLYVKARFNFPYENLILVLMVIISIYYEGYIYKKFLSFDKINPFKLSLMLNLLSAVILSILNFTF